MMAFRPKEKINLSSRIQLRGVTRQQKCIARVGLVDSETGQPIRQYMSTNFWVKFDQCKHLKVGMGEIAREVHEPENNWVGSRSGFGRNFYLDLEKMSRSSKMSQLSSLKSVKKSRFSLMLFGFFGSSTSTRNNFLSWSLLLDLNIYLNQGAPSRFILSMADGVKFFEIKSVLSAKYLFGPCKH